MRKINTVLANQHWRTTEDVASDRFNEQISRDVMLIAYRKTEEIFRADMQELIYSIERIALQGFRECLKSNQSTTG